MKSKQNLSILFWRPMTKKRLSDGMVPIYARITVDHNGGSKEICTDIWLMPEQWDLKNKVVLGEKKYVQDDNDRLSALRLKLKDIFAELAVEHEPISAALLKQQYVITVGIENGDEPAQEVPHTLLETIDDFIIEFEKMVDLGHKQGDT